MKKVKSIGKKIMSVGLAASLLLAPVGANNCCFADNEQAQQVNQGSSKVKDTLKKAGLAGAGIGIYVLIWLLLCNGAHDNYEGYSKIFSENKEVITNFWAAHGDSIVKELGFVKAFGARTATDIGTFIKALLVLAKHLGEDVFEIGDCVYRILERIGFKNVFSAIGAGYVTKKLWDGTKWACNKVADWFKSEPKKEKSGVKKFDMSLIIKDDDSETNNNEAMIEAAYARIKNGY